MAAAEAVEALSAAIRTAERLTAQITDGIVTSLGTAERSRGQDRRRAVSGETAVAAPADRIAGRIKAAEEEASAKIAAAQASGETAVAAAVDRIAGRIKAAEEAAARAMEGLGGAVGSRNEGRRRSGCSA